MQGGVGITNQIAGPTPCSLATDSYADVRSTVSEFIYSDTMRRYRMPCTRVLKLVLSGERVIQDVLYNGHRHTKIAGQSLHPHRHFPFGHATTWHIHCGNDILFWRQYYIALQFFARLANFLIAFT